MTEDVPKHFDDEGAEINPYLISKSDLCITCKKNVLSGEEEILCNLTCADQQGQDEFVCDAYEAKDHQKSNQRLRWPAKKIRT